MVHLSLLPLSVAAAAWPILKAISSRVGTLIEVYGSKAFTFWEPSVARYGWKITGTTRQPRSGITVFD
jgi:hypothetical protein